MVVKPEDVEVDEEERVWDSVGCNVALVPM